MITPGIDLSFPHRWKAEILSARPHILPPRHFTYPRDVEEVERGALEVLIQPTEDSEGQAPCAQPFLATCALGFHDSAVSTGVWSMPNSEEVCTAAGGYAYLIDTHAPKRFTMLPYRPVFAIVPAVARGLLLFAGNRSILAWSVHGLAWESPKLSDEGITIVSVDGGTLHGLGWNMLSDKETPFALDLGDGRLIAGT